jgi:hypothetical protein
VDTLAEGKVGLSISSLCKSEQLIFSHQVLSFHLRSSAQYGAVPSLQTGVLNMFSQTLQFVHQIYPGNDTITESRCPQCGVQIAAATQDNYLVIAEAAAKIEIWGDRRQAN